MSKDRKSLWGERAAHNNIPTIKFRDLALQVLESFQVSVSASAGKAGYSSSTRFLQTYQHSGGGKSRPRRVVTTRGCGPVLVIGFNNAPVGASSNNKPWNKSIFELCPIYYVLESPEENKNKMNKCKFHLCSKGLLNILKSNGCLSKNQI